MPSARPPAGLPVWGGKYAVRKTAATLAAHGDRCHLCPDRSSPATTADHIVPRSKALAAGVPLDLVDDVVEQLRPAHHACNSARGDLDLWQWFALHPLPAEPALPPSRKW